MAGNYHTTITGEYVSHVSAMIEKCLFTMLSSQDITRIRKEINDHARIMADSCGLLDYNVFVVITRNPNYIDVSLSDITTVVADKYENNDKKISKNHIFIRSRKQPYCLIRQIIYFIGHHLCGHSLTDIGIEFGYTHATVLNGCNVVRNAMETDRRFRGKMEYIIESVKEFYALSLDA